ncbi:23298_t:CDS:2 [Entrophospora sp. SA101]|nr:23298_t:CDS:2 [Entrophospora sp. SA101]
MCFSAAKWKREQVQDHKFDFVNIKEFKEESWLRKIRYSFVFLVVIKSVLVYVGDLWTAGILLFLGHWGTSIQPVIPIAVSKWIFLGSILASFLLLILDGVKAKSILISKDISYTFTNTVAYRYYTVKSYSYYCFFSQINNSQKITDRIAFFVFFTFKGWKRLLFAEAPQTEPILVNDNDTPLENLNTKEESVAAALVFANKDSTDRNKTTSPLINNLTTNELPTSGASVSSSAGEGSSRGVRRNSQSKTTDNNNSNSSSEYECNICFDTAGSPVLTWLEAQSLNPLCPVCKAGCGQDKVIPVYGRGKEAKDPRKNSDIPNRPAGQRPRPQRDPNLPSTQFFPGLNIHSTTLMPHFSISVSTIFPTVFSPQITFPPANGPPSEQQAFLSRILFMLGVLILICFYFN